MLLLVGVIMSLKFDYFIVYYEDWMGSIFYLIYSLYSYRITLI